MLILVLSKFLILKRNKWLAWQGSRINEPETWSSFLSVGLASCNAVGNLNILVSWIWKLSVLISWAEKFSCCGYAGAWKAANYGRSSAGSGINQTVGFVDLKKPITLTLINWSLFPITKLQYCAESLEILRRRVFVVYSPPLPQTRPLLVQRLHYSSSPILFFLSLTQNFQGPSCSFSHLSTLAVRSKNWFLLEARLIKQAMTTLTTDPIA